MKEGGSEQEEWKRGREWREKRQRREREWKEHWIDEAMRTELKGDERVCETRRVRDSQMVGRFTVVGRLWRGREKGSISDSQSLRSTEEES